MARRLMLAMALAFGLVTGTAAADERVDGFAHALRADPVVVSSALTRAVPPAEVAALRRTVEAAPLRTFVVVAPSFGGEPGLETLRALPDLLHDRLGREGIYLAVDQSSFAYAQAFGTKPRFDVDDLFVTVADDRPDAAPGEAARYAVQLLTTGRRAPVPRRPSRDEDDVAALPVIAAGLGAGAAGFAVAGWPWLVARRRRLLARRAAVLATAVPVDDPQALREQALAELEALSARLAAAEAPPAAAFDAYAAASKLLEDGDRPIDVVGALELARAGRAALEGRPRRPCFFDPRHGPAAKRTRWRLGREETDIPACRACARAVASGRTPPALDDGGRPYFERDTLWARTGFGALDDELAARVLAGEARR